MELYNLNMTDVLSNEQRHKCMTNIKGKDTKPEIWARRFIHRKGYRYILHDNELPGKPDMVFPRLKKIIFVHGCFWHIHNCKYGKVRPATNASFWENKRTLNKKRDKKICIQLRNIGWHVFIIWECQIRKKTTEQRILKFLAS